MDIQTATYITDFYSDLLTLRERHVIAQSISEQFDDVNALTIIKGGNYACTIKTATIILERFKDKVFLNNCPKCDKLARTPMAKQCRFCTHDWH